MAYGRGVDLSIVPVQRRPEPAMDGVVARAVALAAPVLVARRQSLTFAPAAPAASAGRSATRLCALLAAAIHELSACTVRRGAISCTVLRHAVVLRGENPIILPEYALTLDWMTQVRAKALGVRAIFEWEQGRGPLLTLILPSPRGASREKDGTLRELCPSA
jgi:hypothetical protein